MGRRGPLTHLEKIKINVKMQMVVKQNRIKSLENKTFGFLISFIVRKCSKFSGVSDSAHLVCDTFTPRVVISVSNQVLRPSECPRLYSPVSLSVSVAFPDSPLTIRHGGSPAVHLPSDPPRVSLLRLFTHSGSDHLAQIQWETRTCFSKRLQRKKLFCGFLYGSLKFC